MGKLEKEGMFRRVQESVWPILASVSRSVRSKAIPSHPEFPDPTFGSHGPLLLPILLRCVQSLYFKPTTKDPTSIHVCLSSSFLSFHPWRPSSCVKAEAISPPGWVDPYVNISMKEPTVVKLFSEFQTQI